MPFVELISDKVSWTEEGLAQKEVLALKKFKDKDFLQDFGTYLYWVYKPSGFYENEFPSTKKVMVCERHINNRKWEEFEDVKECREIINLYIKLSYSLSERAYMKLRLDIEEYFDHLHAIPWVKKLKVEVNVPIEDGTITVTQKIVEFSNADEKSKTMKQMNDIVDWEEKLKLKIFKESKGKKHTIRLFDRSE